MDRGMVSPPSGLRFGCALFSAPRTNAYADSASRPFDSGNSREFSCNFSGTSIKKKSFISIRVVQFGVNVLYGIPRASFGT